MRLVLALCLAVAVTLTVASCTPKESETTAPTADQPVAATPATDQPVADAPAADTPPDPAETDTAQPDQPTPATGSAAGADWPRFHGPTANGIAPDTGINKNWNSRPPKELWKVRLGDDGYAGPCVAGGLVYIIDHRGQDDVVRALDFKTGKDVWEYPYSEPGGANYGFAHSTPCYDNGRLFTVSCSGQVHALSAPAGKLIWSKNLQKDFGGGAPSWRYAASPVVDGDRLVVLPGGSNSVAVLNKTNGEKIWAGGGSFNAGYATPTIATIGGTKQYIVFTGKALTGVSAKDGKLLWQVPWETQHGVNAAMPIVEDTYVFATSNYSFGGGVYQITGGGAQKVWFSKVMHSHFSSPVYYNGYIFGTTDPGDLVCLAPSNGGEVWRQSGFEKGGIVIVDDTIIALNGGNGDLIMAQASADGYKELGRTKPPLGGQSWTAPIVAHGKLLVRNKAALVCLELM